jgi:hypothetical protein
MKAEQDLPVAVHVICKKHGPVTAVKVTPSGNAFLRQVSLSKSRTRSAEWPKELRPLASNIRRGSRVFLDETDEDISTLCNKGEHSILLPTLRLRQMVTEFKRGNGKPLTLKL